MTLLKSGFEKSQSVSRRVRSVFYFLLSGVRFKSIGVHPKIRGERCLRVQSNVSLGDFCWIEAVTSYAGQEFEPLLTIGSNVSLSDSVHISCVKSVTISDGTLIGSKVYVGDHSHRSYRKPGNDSQIEPAKRLLGDIAPVAIGRNCWIGDNVVILAGTEIGDGCVVGANSVVKGKFADSKLIAGIPARVVKEL